MPTVHISDLVALYALVVTKVLQKELIPSGRQGHYFGFAHRSPTHALMDRIATALYTRGLVTDTGVTTWPNYSVAADASALPELYIKSMCMSTGDLVPVNPYTIDWKPEWDEKRYLAGIDDEVQAALHLDTVPVSRYDTLLAAEE
jgi:hypothetical protein